MSVQKLCVDLGNGGFKGASVRIAKPAEGDQPEVREIFTAFLPSKVGIGSVGMGALTLGGFEKRSRSDAERKPIQVVSDEGAYLVGHNVERYTTLLERFEPSKYADSPELRSRACFARADG